MRALSNSFGILFIDLQKTFRVAIIISACGDPEHIRLAIRKACSRRRTIISMRPAHFFSNLVHQLVGYGQDIVECMFFTEDSLDDDLPNKYHLTITDNGMACIRCGQGKNWEAAEPVFQFLGHERVRQTQPRRLSGKKLGRPTRVKALVAQKRLEQALSSGDDSENFLPASTYKPGEEPWRETIARKRKEKAAKEGRRIAVVDFSLIKEVEQDESLVDDWHAGAGSLDK